MGIFDKKKRKTPKEVKETKGKEEKPSISKVTAIYNRDGVPTIARGINPDHMDRFMRAVGKVTNFKTIKEDK